MRLTLRTLLAHLDRTLEADDDATIAVKLRESDFASQLARRITASISNNQLSAPSPVSTSTADDPNRIAEYLDSVLSAEQVAEIERICLESEQHLSEVAACHQILTLVLGNRAEIPASLRNRIYAIGEDTNVSYPDPRSSNGTIADPSHPAGYPHLEIGAGDAITRAIATDLGPAGGPAGMSLEVEPVGPDDSGVSDAPTRLREVAYANAQAVAQRNEPVMAGSRPLNAAEASELFGRPSRYVPWLVTLGLLAAFLFVATQAFAPLLRNKSRVDDQPLAGGDAPSIVSPIEPETTTESLLPAQPAAETSAVEVDATVTPPMVDLNEPIAEGLELRLPSEVTSSDRIELPPSPAETVNTGMSIPTEKVSIAGSDVGAGLPDSVVEIAMDSPPPSAEMKDEDVAVPMELPGSALVSNESVLLVRNGDDYVLTKKGEPLPNACELISPPLFRDRLTLLDRIDLMLVGPAKVVLETTDGNDLLITPSLGRLTLAPLAVSLPSPDSEEIQIDAPEPRSRVVTLVYGGAKHQLTFADPLSLAAVQIVSARQPGSDPEDESSIVSFMEVIAVEGSLSWETDSEGAIVIKAGELLRRLPTGESTKVPLQGGLDWVNKPLVASGSIDLSARDGLLTLVRGAEPIEMSLRESINFRRAEVGALAAQTLALVDRPTVYFGSGGVLNDIKQKAYWQQHFETLVDTINRGPESAANVRQAINQMDAAEATAIYRLLWMFSNEQLEAGSDELLVANLDSSNMTVRVLAAENLRKITGTTLFYKPESETAPRRSSDIKKWEARLRKGEIRWSSK